LPPQRGSSTTLSRSSNVSNANGPSLPTEGIVFTHPETKYKSTAKALRRIYAKNLMRCPWVLKAKLPFPLKAGKPAVRHDPTFDKRRISSKVSYAPSSKNRGSAAIPATAPKGEM